MVDTEELIRHIKNIEDKLKINMNDTIRELEIPVDFHLDDVSVDLVPIQEIGQVTKNYIVRNVKLYVSWDTRTNRS